MASEKLASAISAIKAGDKKTGFTLLKEIVRSDPANETAWLWLSTCVQTPDKKFCLSKALAINPANENARKALAQYQMLAQPSLEELSPVPASISTVEAAIKSSGNSGFEEQRTPPKETPAQPQVQSKPSTVNIKRRNAPFNKWILLAALAGLTVIVVIFGIELLSQPQPDGKAFVPEATITSGINPQAAPGTSSACKSDVKNYNLKIASLMTEFMDTVQIASSTSRIALAPVVQTLQRVRRDVAILSAPDCALSAQNLLLTGMDGTINGFLDFMSEASDTKVEKEISQGITDIGSATDQLLALAEGKVTPSPVILPSNTPRPTLTPSRTPTKTPTSTATPTPFPPGSEVIFGDWQIKVEKVMVTDEVSQYGSIYKPEGQFLLIFMTVVNRDNNPHGWSGFDTLELKDSKGIIYTENIDASFGVAESYDLNDMLYISNPGDFISVVMVFDVPIGKKTFVLVPSQFSIQTETTATLLIEVP